MGWKKTRREELKKFFGRKFETFEDLKEEVAPILWENKIIYEKYYLNDQKILWDKFEGKILANNKKLKALLSGNLDLIQRHSHKSYSNLAIVQTFLAHVDEFEETRTESEKTREILFPKEINSMFGIAPVQDFIIPSTESLELLIKNLKRKANMKPRISAATGRISG